ncbi:DinB family protein [Ciceribacter ferrooxidans]|uniref:Damage-inducible protein DinB n=1 Tax=Ciceribacter ferrooxidans TaxID=2509717 RepID=A0A4V1RRV3_9HYPH|nr:DinB family protein [Ciceribacter ferrooxidans]RYC17754.1 damage-inducible protein DinB [Ciceribacter ferrooxidans]
MLQHCQMFAAYNRWANERVYAAAAELTEDELFRDTGAFFGSLFGTLSHILVGDRVWMRRFTGEGPVPRALDERPYETFAELAAARKAEDERIIRWVDGLDEASLDARISYTTIVKPEPISHKLGAAVAHFFNHQTHHRGQAHMALTALGKPSLILDLVYFQRQEGQQWI